MTKEIVGESECGQRESQMSGQTFQLTELEIRERHLTVLLPSQLQTLFAFDVPSPTKNVVEVSL